MKLPNWFKIIWWVLLFIAVSVFLYTRLEQISKGMATTADIFAFLVWVALGLLPLFEELSFFGITLKKEVDKLRSDITNQISNLKADIRNTVNLQVVTPISGQVSPIEADDKESPRHPMEYKILNTLFIKQVNKFPDFSTLFAFTVNQDPEYQEFCEAAGKLVGEGFIKKTDTGYYHFTHKGWDWCKDNYSHFPPTQWWPNEPIDEENLRRVLENHRRKGNAKVTI